MASIVWAFCSNSLALDLMALLWGGNGQLKRCNRHPMKTMRPVYVVAHESCVYQNHFITRFYRAIQP